MKNLLSILIFTALLTACTSENLELEKAEQFIGEIKWELVEMQGGFANTPPDTGDKMFWQEYYLLQPDSTFLKSRLFDGVTTEVRGTYSYVTLSDEPYIAFQFNTDSELISSCYNEEKELLRRHHDSQLISTWNACDGPSLLYEKVE
jgi:hypothetical protein